MNKQIRKSSFFEILLLDDKEKLKNFLLENGKSPKPRSPVTFMDMNNIDDINFYGNFNIL